MGALNRHKGALVGIADGEFRHRLSPEFTLRLAKVTLLSRATNSSRDFVAPVILCVERQEPRANRP
jgi:hypothetical protein